jgi:amino acid adenylation domain-containing protein
MQNAPSAGFRLSPQQARLWAAEHNGGSFFSECVLHFTGRFDPEAFRAALSRAIERHEILRTTFVRQPGMKLPLQVISEQSDLKWHDLQSAARLPADGEGLQAGGVRLGPDHYTVHLRAPALCLDTASMGALGVECCVAMGAVPPPEGVPDEPLQYADFAEWQHQTHEADDEEARAAKTYWAQPALRAPAPVLLPGQLPNPSAGAFDPKGVGIGVQAGVWQRVFSLARQWQISEEAILLACWQSLLARLLGQTEVVVRCMFDGRTQEAVKGALGLYAQALPVTADIEGRSSRDLVRAAAQSLEEAGRRQEYYAVDDAHEVAAAAALPAFEFLRSSTVHFPDGTTCRVVRAACHVAPFAIKLSCLWRDDDFVLQLFYDPRCLPKADAERIAGYFARLLAGVTENPHALPDTIDILDTDERQHLLAGLEPIAAAYLQDKSIHQLFEEQATRTPQAPALAFSGQRWTYAELNSRTNQIAHLLRRHGVSRNVPVGLFLERSAESILGLLGILKAGGAYVPLLAGMPLERLALQLSQTAAPVLITAAKHLAEVPAEYRGKVVCLDRDAPELDSQPATNPEPINISDDLVYVIFTSGSTGTPKGVAVRHRNLVNYTTFIQKLLGVENGGGTGLHFATVSTLAADLGNTCVFPSLVSGGCLHVIAYETSLSGTAFGQYAAENPIDVLKITPSHLRALLAEPGGSAVLPRRHLVLGGEASSWELIQQVRSSASCAIINHYGPTETTVGALTYRVPAERAATATVPIGRPIANTRVYILDAHGLPVPFGVPGELCIGGAGVAQGYLGQPEQTVCHFVPDPFIGDPNARMYRTGDRARYTATGDIEFLGRVDRQVKIHGFRVEPGEIEAVLQRHPAVRQAVVVARKEDSGVRLCAYFVPASETGSPGSDALREYLGSRLPDYMIPAAFVALKVLPLTANGKIDTRALPDPEHAGVGRTRPLVPPRNAVEEEVAAIWKEVLGVEAIGVEDNFFELGGHSLLATRVLARVQNAFQVRIPLRAIFHTPTVAGLASEVEKLRQPAEEDEMNALLSRLQGLSEEEIQSILAETPQP